MAVVSLLITAAIQIAVAVGVSLVATALRKKPKSETQSLDFEQTVQRRLSNGSPLRILTGRRIVAGDGFFDDAYSVDNEQGVSVTVMSAKPCTAFHTLFLDGEPVELSGDPTQAEVFVTSHFLGKPSSTTQNLGLGITHTVLEGDQPPRVAVRVFLGDDNSGLGSYLASKFPSRYTANDNFGDYCVVVLDCRNTDDDFAGEDDPEEIQGQNYIPFQGYPEYKVEMSGVKVCDPRIDGSSYEDETTYVFSDNAALIDAQYDFGWYSGVGANRALIIGNGYPTQLMSLDQIIFNANYCDNRGYRCAGIVTSGKNDDQDEIWKAFNAERVEQAAVIFTIPEGNRVFSETVDMSLYPAAYVSSYDEDGYSTEVYNEIRTTYAEPEEFFGEKELPIYSEPEWIAADNHIPRQTSLPLLYVTNLAQAAMLQKEEILISRTPATCTLADLPYAFIRVRVGDLVDVTNADIPAINGRTWVVKSNSRTERGDVSLTLREYVGPDAFGFDMATEMPEIELNIPEPRPWEEWWGPRDYVSPIFIADLNGTVTQGLADANSSIGEAIASVAEIVAGEVELNDVLIAGQGSLVDDVGAVTQDLSDTNSDVDDVTSDVEGIIAGTVELTDVLITGQGSLNQGNIARDANIEVAISTASSAGGGTLTASVSPTTAVGTSDQASGTVTSNAVVVTASGGTGPYTYAWSQVSGDTITINAPTSNSTSFTGNPASPDGSLSGVFKCTVTDDSAPAETFVINVSVSIIRFDNNGF